MASVTLSLDESAFSAFKADVLTHAREAVPEATKALVGFAGATISKRLEGFGSIRRIDTTRLQGSYETAASQIASTPVPHGEAVVASDVVAETLATGLTTTYRIGSDAHYAGYIEYGTEKIVAGLHVDSTAYDATRAAQTVCTPFLRRAFA